MKDSRLHKLRIQCKGLRYLAEFFKSLFDKEVVDPFIEHLVALQDLIGEQHDSVVAVERLENVRDFLIERLGARSATVKALNKLIEAGKERAKGLKGEVPGAFEAFLGFAESKKWRDALDSLVSQLASDASGASDASDASDAAVGLDE